MIAESFLRLILVLLLTAALFANGIFLGLNETGTTQLQSVFIKHPLESFKYKLTEDGGNGLAGLGGGITAPCHPKTGNLE